MRAKALLSWSSGKDAAWALHRLRTLGEVDVVGLVTTVNAAAGRVAMHAVREALLRAQAAAAGLPLVTVPLPSPCSNEEYEAAFGRALAEARAQGVAAVAFGDIFLEDVRAYRERQVAAAGLAPLFPLWGLDTRALAGEMRAAGVRARITCIDPRILPRELAGREWDESLLAELPAGVDPCGERGEFHTFCWNGPMFARAVDIEIGETVERDGFRFTDLRPARGAATPSIEAVRPAAPSDVLPWEEGPPPE